MRKRRASSRNAKDFIACVLIACVLMLLSNRVIESPHDLSTVECNMQVQFTNKMGMGIYLRLGGGASVPLNRQSKVHWQRKSRAGISLKSSWICFDELYLIINTAITQNEVAFEHDSNLNEGDMLIEYADLLVAKSKYKEGNEQTIIRQNSLFACLRKRRASSRIAKDFIACVLIACVKMLLSNRVIE